MQNDPHTTLVTPTAPIANTTHGGRAKCLQRLVRLDLPVPRTIALSFDVVQQIARGQMPDVQGVVDQFPKGALLCVRPSSQDPDWGGPGAVLNIGINDALFESYAGTIGEGPAAALYSRFVQSYAVNVARLDPDMFDDVNGDGRAALMASLRAYEAETEERFPQDPATQLAAVLRSMARAWNGTSARLLRQAKGAPADAGLGLVVQEMAFGVGQGQCGSGVLQLVDSDTGLP
ncbi:MAG TPA: pyruvate, phosphate dikinase, partial [Sulfitobacter sp.]|nr:pyruvate, phosphate dikinase [Sulfitobacter sp.]